MEDHQDILESPSQYFTLLATLSWLFISLIGLRVLSFARHHYASNWLAHRTDYTRTPIFDLLSSAIHIQISNYAIYITKINPGRNIYLIVNPHSTLALNQVTVDISSIPGSCDAAHVWQPAVGLCALKYSRVYMFDVMVEHGGKTWAKKVVGLKGVQKWIPAIRDCYVLLVAWSTSVSDFFFVWQQLEALQSLFEAGSRILEAQQSMNKCRCNQCL